jgi:VIT1/CCC1 family predicted Fe2+/Mn2+ transporter
MFKLKQSIKTGLSFGLTSGIITTLGLMVGLHSGTHSQKIVMSGILVIAIADAFSDALGIHISEESDHQVNTKEVWESTISTFLSKFIIALTFIIPVLFLELSLAIIVSVIWGLFLIAIISFYIAKEQNQRPHLVILEHLFITVLVIIITYYIGNWVNALR